MDLSSDRHDDVNIAFMRYRSTPPIKSTVWRCLETVKDFSVVTDDEAVGACTAVSATSVAAAVDAAAAAVAVAATAAASAELISAVSVTAEVIDVVVRSADAVYVSSEALAAVAADGAVVYWTTLVPCVRLGTSVMRTTTSSVLHDDGTYSSLTPCNKLINLSSVSSYEYLSIHGHSKYIDIILK